MAIETAFVAPVLLILTFGIFEVATLVARQHELQSAANESEIIAIADNRGADAKIEQVKAILRTSLGLTEDQVTLSQRFRCGTEDELATDINDCDEDEVVSTYLTIDIRETHVPKWTAFGIGRPVELAVTRTVQVSSQ